jgi:site-specific recombinase XerD
MNHLTNAAEAVGVLARLTDEARAYINASASPNTRRAYAGQMVQWMVWASEHGVSDFPAAPADVANWLAKRGGAGQCVSTLRTAVAAIKAGHDAKGMPFDSKAPVIVKTVRGISNLSPRLPRQAEPIRGADVLAMLLASDASPIGLRDAALLALGYVFALRRAELVALDLDKLGTGDGVLRITAKTIEITLARSKNAKGEPQVVAIPREQNTEAVIAIERWIAKAGIRPGERLMRGITKGGAISDALHPQSVSKIIKARVAEYHMRRQVPADKARKESERYSGHSLRVGFSVSAAEAGADLRAIASVTRHRSLVMPARYAQKAEQIRTSPHNLKGVGLSSAD